MYGQDEIRGNNPPPPKNLNEIATYNVNDNITRSALSNEIYF